MSKQYDVEISLHMRSNGKQLLCILFRNDMLQLLDGERFKIEVVTESCNRIYFKSDDHGVKSSKSCMLNTENQKVIRQLLEVNAVGQYDLKFDAPRNLYYVNLDEKAEGSEHTVRRGSPTNHSPNSVGNRTSGLLLERKCRPTTVPYNPAYIGLENTPYSILRDELYKKLFIAVKDGNIDRAKVFVELLEEM